MQSESFDVKARASEVRFLRFGWAVILLGVGGFLVWANVAPLDRGIAVQGALVAEGNRQSVQHTAGGRIQSLMVREGERVVEGQVLMRLDKTQSQALLNASLASERGLGEQIQATLRTKGSKQTQAQLLDQQLAGLRPLAQEGLVPANRVLEMERQAAQLKGLIAQDGGLVAQAQQQLQEVRERIVSQKHDVEQAEIRAPASGVAQSLSVFGPGAVISPGQVLLEIVPASARLLAEAQVPVNLIDRLQPGLQVELMFTALNQAQTPTGKGEVLVVSPDRIVDERTGVPYYRIQTSIDMVDMPDGAPGLRHGMPVELFVKTGERTLVSYLLKPLNDRMRSGMREN